jgi:hypothetical protein
LCKSIKHTSSPVETSENVAINFRFNSSEKEHCITWTHADEVNSELVKLLDDGSATRTASAHKGG